MEKKGVYFSYSRTKRGRGVIPNFLIIGAQKAGTTSLLRYLEAHPDIFVSDEKEVSIHYDDKEYNKKFDKYAYEKYFDSWDGQKWAGNAPANLLYFAETTAAAIHKYNPSMKLIAILRNPIERAYSAYWFFVRTGFEKDSFEKALEREKQILKTGSFGQKANLTYVSHGYYFEQLMLFYQFFNREQLLVLIFDDLKSDLKSVLNQVYRFLKIEELYPDDLMRKKFNIGSKSKIQFISDLIYGDSVLKKLYKGAVTPSLRHYISTKLIRKIKNKNLEPFNYPAMHADTKAHLQKIFFEPNRKLAELLNRDLSAWR